MLAARAGGVAARVRGVPAARGLAMTRGHPKNPGEGGGFFGLNPPPRTDAEKFDLFHAGHKNKDPLRLQVQNATRMKRAALRMPCGRAPYSHALACAGRHEPSKPVLQRGGVC